MSLLQTHMDFATFLDYHGTTIADSLLVHYVDLFDSFCQFQFDNPYIGSTDKAFIKWKREYQPTPTFVSHLEEIPMLPYPSIAGNNNNIPTVIVSATSTTTTALINESNKQTEQAVNQLVADYLDDDIQQLLNIEPIEPLNSVNSPTSSASISPPPELKSFPLLSDHTDICSPPPQPTTTTGTATARNTRSPERHWRHEGI
jgi:hypothetical protein